MKQACWIALYAALLCAGCSGEAAPNDKDAAGSGSAPSEDGDSYLEFMTQYTQASCEREARCDSPPKHPTVDACNAATSEDLTRARARIAVAIDAGQVRYHSTIASTCLEQIKTTCTPAIVPACSDAIEGFQSLGEVCTGSFACADHEGDRAYCFKECTAVTGSEPSDTTGTCVSPSPIGTPACP
jgi:hypothetical protein